MRVRLGLLAMVALAVASAGCMGAAPLTEDPQPAQEEPETPTKTLTLLATPSEDAIVDPELLDVHVDPLPRPAVTYNEGPGQGDDAGRIVEAEVPQGHEVSAFEVELTVHDGLGPATVSLSVPAWTADENETVEVRLDMPEVGLVEIDVHGDIGVEPVENPSNPQYGYLDFADGAKKPLSEFPHVIELPEHYPRFGPDAEPTFELEDPDATVQWTLDGEPLEEANSITIDPGHGKHVLLVEDPDKEASVELIHSIHHRFTIEDEVLVGTSTHRESVAELNEDTYEIEIREGATVLRAILEPIGKHTDLEDLDLYALNETGGVLDQSTGNTTEEHLALPRSDLYPGESVYVKVHGNKAGHTEYKLTVSTFYSPW